MGKVTDWESQPAGRLTLRYRRDQFQIVCGIGREQDDLAGGTKSLEGAPVRESRARVSGGDEGHQKGPNLKAGVQGE